MAFEVSFIRHTFLWQLLPGEVASTSCAWTDGSGITSIDDATLEELSAAAATLWGTIKPNYGDKTAFIGSRLQLVSTAGTVVQTRETIITGVPGTSTASSLPTEVAIVVSLQTTNAGRSGRGRMYFPAPAVSQVDDDGRVTGFFQGLLADAAQDYLSTTLTSSIAPYVMSQTTAGAQPVTNIRVGNVYDAQRRRRDALAEVYVDRGI